MSSHEIRISLRTLKFVLVGLITVEIPNHQPSSKFVNQDDPAFLFHPNRPPYPIVQLNPLFSFKKRLVFFRCLNKFLLFFSRKFLNDYRRGKMKPKITPSKHLW